MSDSVREAFEIVEQELRRDIPSGGSRVVRALGTIKAALSANGGEAVPVAGIVQVASTCFKQVLPWDEAKRQHAAILSASDSLGSPGDGAELIPLYPAPPSVVVPEGWKAKVLDLCSAVENDEDLPPVKYALKCGRLINEVKDMLTAAPAPDHSGDANKMVTPELFKAFHAALCRRLGYTHDEQYWWRDLVSLEEHIAAKVPDHIADAGKVVQPEHEETDCIELLGMMARITPDRPSHTVALTKEQALGIYREADRLRDRAIHFSNWPAFYYASRYFGRLCGPATPSVPENEVRAEALDRKGQEFWDTAERLTVNIAGYKQRSHDRIKLEARVKTLREVAIECHAEATRLRTAGDDGEEETHG